MKKFIECLIPTTVCNLQCHYCYVIQTNRRKMKNAAMQYSSEHIGKALSKDRLGGISFISLCGAGETLAQPETIDIVFELLKQGHFVNITTNGTITDKFQKIVHLPYEALSRLHFSFSFHYLELVKKGLIDTFFDNIIKIKDVGCSYFVQINLTDEYMPFLEEIKKLCFEKIGAHPQVPLTRDDSSSPIKVLTQKPLEEYQMMGQSMGSPLFEFTYKNFQIKRKEFCYAGAWTGTLNLATGYMTGCYGSGIHQNIFEDISKPIQFHPVGHNCQNSFCFNSSHFMSLGVIPEIKTPTYSELRNRPEASWYTKTMIDFLSQKLFDNNHFDIRRSLYKSDLLHFIRKQDDPYLLTDMPGNIGDHLIWAGTIDLLNSGNICFKQIPVSKVGTENYNNSTLIIPGSGAFDKRWHEWLPETVLKASTSFKKVIILPSSFDLSVDIVIQCLSQHNVYAFAREVKSYEAMKYLGRAALSFDCAIYYNLFNSTKINNQTTKNCEQDHNCSILLALREDMGSLLPIQGFMPNPKMNKDISLTMKDLNSWINTIAKSTTIITDRLHVAVASVLIGKQLIYLDAYNQKLSTYFNYTFRNNFEALISQCSISWLIENQFIIPNNRENK